MHPDIRSVQVCSKLTMEHLNSNYPVWIKKKPDSVYEFYFYPIYQLKEVITLLHRNFVFFPSGLLICDKFGLILSPDF